MSLSLSEWFELEEECKKKSEDDGYILVVYIDKDSHSFLKDHRFTSLEKFKNFVEKFMEVHKLEPNDVPNLMSVFINGHKKNFSIEPVHTYKISME